MFYETYNTQERVCFVLKSDLAKFDNLPGIHYVNVWTLRSSVRDLRIADADADAALAVQLVLSRIGILPGSK